MAVEAERQLLRAAKPDLRLVEDDALNAETPVPFLDAQLTPIPAFFVRNNARLPAITPEEAAAWRLVVDGEVERPASFSLAGLKRDFVTVSFAAVLECAGNGRAGFDTPTEGLQWDLGAVGCARWTGVRLADILAAVGVKPSAVYVGHLSPDAKAISRGLPLAKAMAPETLVAFAMNDEPLPFLHGGPLRIVAPGFPGSAWQKWLNRIWVRDREHDGEKMRGTNYRLPTAPVRPGDPVDPDFFRIIEDMPVKSLITSPADGFEASAGRPIAVRGFGWSGHTPLAAVAVSADGGGSWIEANLEPAGDPFAWRRFEAAVRFPSAGLAMLMARARDVAGRLQPIGSAPWNPRGYCNNAVHRVRGTIGSG